MISKFLVRFGLGIHPLHHTYASSAYVCLCMYADTQDSVYVLFIISGNTKNIREAYFQSCWLETTFGFSTTWQMHFSVTSNLLCNLKLQYNESLEGWFRPACHNRLRMTGEGQPISSLKYSPNCIRAINEKHICMQAPTMAACITTPENGFSVVLMALVDVEYKLRVIQIGGYSRSSDGGVFAKPSWKED